MPTGCHLSRFGGLPRVAPGRLGSCGETGAKRGWDKRGRGRKEQIPTLNPRKRDPTRVKLRKRDNPMKIQGKQRKYRQDPTSKILRKPEDFAGKQFIMKARIQNVYGFLDTILLKYMIRFLGPRKKN